MWQTGPSPRFADVQRDGSQPRPTGLILLLTVALLVLLLAAYIGVMHALVEMSRVETDDDAAQRDAAYAYLHLVLVAGAAIIGFVAGKWFNGLGIAFATLFVVVMVVGTLATQMVTFEMACHGHNDVVRHWQCWRRARWLVPRSESSV